MLLLYVMGQLTKNPSTMEKLKFVVLKGKLLSGSFTPSIVNSGPWPIVIVCWKYDRRKWQTCRMYKDVGITAQAFSGRTMWYPSAYTMSIQSHWSDPRSCSFVISHHSGLDLKYGNIPFVRNKAPRMNCSAYHVLTSQVESFTGTPRDAQPSLAKV